MLSTMPPEQTDTVEEESDVTQQPSTDDTEPSPIEEPDEQVDLSLDLSFEILKNERRRLVLEHLSEANGPIKLGDLAERIAAQENDTSVRGINSAERKRVYVGLYQCHLPKMDDADIINYNANRGLIEKGPNADELEQYLNSTTGFQRPWYRFYGGIAAIGTGLFAGSVLGFLPLAVAMGLTLILLLGCAGFHAIKSHNLGRS